ncbi:hypothetical protein C8D87_113153 [Lentzea atacamensis]|uniref:Lipoprotein n=1 Tax=Lentzea atacamensis TaxID=531938 RepID=A0ABX9DX90_9PSEU|nr:hypothetical protein [Lentzea atacamensis]RAS59847.1 hypothetical protein C8D87_113153 [Lentzea atacamensis]
MAGGLRAFALVVALLATVTACGRSSEEIARLRQAVEAEMANAPLPPGAQLLHGRFDKGCRDFWECADGPDRPAVYEADLYLGRPLSGPASMCAYFVTMLRQAGFQLFGKWDNAWFAINAGDCAAGHPGNGVVMRNNGSPFSDKATLEFTLLDGGRVAPRYELTYRRPVEVERSDVRLTRSMIAHLRNELDREFVLAADPVTDGIASSRTTGRQWTVDPSTTSLRFEVTCDQQREVELTARDPVITGQDIRTGQRTVPCTGAATVIDIPVSLKGDKAFVAVSADQPYLVRFVSAG